MKLNHLKPGKIILQTFAASMLAGFLGAPVAMAQSAPTGNNPVANFDNGYLDEHPQVTQQLSANPNLIDDPKYMQSHPGLQRYLSSHPGVRTDIKQNPTGFMSQESQFNGSSADHRGWGNGQGAAGRFDRGYLDSHPEVANQLAANPSLATNQ
jgi:hypothetical protein